jgi:hypothetical protein
MTMELDLIYQAEHKVLSLMEETGALVAHLREGLADLNNGNMPGGAMVIDDAIATLATMEMQVSEMGALLAKWRDFEKNTNAQTPRREQTSNPIESHE